MLAQVYLLEPALLGGSPRGLCISDCLYWGPNSPRAAGGPQLWLLPGHTLSSAHSGREEMGAQTGNPQAQHLQVTKTRRACHTNGPAAQRYLQATDRPAWG